MNIQKSLFDQTQYVLSTINIKSFSKFIQIQQSTQKKFGDYQINGLITIAKKINISPEIIGNKIKKKLELNDMIQTVKIEPLGFINIFLHPKWIENQINHIVYTLNLGINKTINPKTIVIDYSGPNVAKEMHVGHLRSTIIGDSIARILSFLGENVIRANHIGDWGTQFGMLITYIEKYTSFQIIFDDNIQLSVLEDFYRKSKKKYDTDPNFAQLSRNNVVKLQQGDGFCTKIWKRLVDISISTNQKIYTRLHVTLKKNDIMGESVYKNLLPEIIKDLKNKKLAVKSNGATVVFIDHTYYNKHNTPFGVIIQKKDGAYLYSTTDIACIKYRCEQLHADRIIYYTDSRQKQHLTQIIEISKKAGYIKKSVSLEHHICGMLLEKNKQPFKTRSGDPIKLTKLLDESLKRAHQLILQKNPNLTSKQKNKLAHIISIGAIKYSELSKNRTINYIFDWNNMLKFEGNTAPYIQYAYTRISAVFRNAKRFNITFKNCNIRLYTEEEISLAICLLQFEETLILVSERGTPHILCKYLYRLSVLFSRFYENHPILLKKENITIQKSRLKLLMLIARILKKGLNLLGIKTIDYM